MGIDEKIKKMIINASEDRHKEHQAGLWVLIDPSDLPPVIKQIKQVVLDEIEKISFPCYETRDRVEMDDIRKILGD